MAEKSKDTPKEDLVAATGTRAFPRDDLSLEVKADKPWNVLVGRAIWGNRSLYSNGLFYMNRSVYSDNLDWALGRQRKDYKPFLGIDPNSNDKTWGKAINWEIRNYITKRINIIVEKVMQYAYDVEVRNINPIAIDKKEDLLARYQLYLDERKWFNKIAKDAGIDFEDSIPGGNHEPSTTMEQLPQSQEELDLFAENDYKAIAEIAMELGIKHHMARNKYDKIREMAVFSSLVYGVAATYDGMDDMMMPMLEYCSPLDLIVPYSKTPDWSSLPYVGQLIWMSAAEFRKSAAGFMKDEDIEWVITNKSTGPEAGINYTDDLIRATDVHRICVMRYNYRSVDTIVKVSKKDALGNVALYDKPDDYLGPANADGKREFDSKNGTRKLYRKQINTVYEGYWVVDTDHVYRQGPRSASMRRRGSMGEDLMGYKIFAPNAWEGYITPIIEQVKPTLDLLQKYTLKLQQTVGAAIPKGGFIDLWALRNANLKWDGKEMTDQQKIEMFFQKGWGIISSKHRHGPGQQQKPFIEAENGMAKDVIMYSRLIQDALIELDEIIGLNRAASASTVSPELGKGVFQEQIIQSEVAIGWAVRCDRHLFNDTCESLAILHTRSVKYGPKKYYDRIFGRLLTGVLYSDIDYDKCDFGFLISVRPTKEEWVEFLAHAKEGYANGKGFLTYSQLLRVQEFESLKQARRYLAMCESRFKREQADLAEQSMESNAKLQAQAAMDKAKGDIAIEKEKQTTERVKGSEERLTLRLKYNLDTQMKIAISQGDKGLLPPIQEGNLDNMDQLQSPSPQVDAADGQAAIESSLVE